MSNTLIIFGHRVLFMIKNNLEKVQMRATKLLKEVKNLSYVERLKYLSLPTYCNIEDLEEI